MPSPFAFPGDFRRLWIGQTISAFGDKVSRIALPTVALLGLGGTAWDVGLLAALRFVPFVLIGSVAGVWVDRLSHRGTMIWADVGRLVAMGSIPVVSLFGVLTLGQLFVVAGVVGVLTVFFEVAAQSCLPVLAGPDGIVAGNERLQTSRAVAEVGGAAAAGGLMQILGAALTILADALSFLASLVSLLLMRHRESPVVKPEKPRSALAEAREGLAVLLSDTRLRNLMFASTTVNLGVATANALVLVFAYDQGKLSPGAVGLAFAIGTVGLILGAVSSGAIAGRLTLGRTLATSILLTGLGFLLLPVGGQGATADHVDRESVPHRFRRLGLQYPRAQPGPAHYAAGDDGPRQRYRALGGLRHRNTRWPGRRLRRHGLRDLARTGGVGRNHLLRRGVRPRQPLADDSGRSGRGGAPTGAGERHQRWGTPNSLLISTASGAMNTTPMRNSITPFRRVVEMGSDANSWSRSGVPRGFGTAAR